MVSEASRASESNAKSKPTESFLATVGSKDAKWEDMYQRGVSASAPAEQQFAALKVLEVCAPPLLNVPYAELPGAPEDLIATVSSARKMIEARCAVIWKEGADRVRRDWMNLKSRVEASPLSPQHVAFTRRASPKKIGEAADRMQALFSRYGAAALYWVGPEFGHYLEVSSGPLAQRVRTLDPDGKVLYPAIGIATCQASGICGVDGLPYLAACASAGSCGAQDLGVTSSMSGIEVEHATAMANWIAEAIQSNSWR